MCRKGNNRYFIKQFYYFYFSLLNYLNSVIIFCLSHFELLPQGRGNIFPSGGGGGGGRGRAGLTSDFNCWGGG